MRAAKEAVLRHSLDALCPFSYASMGVMINNRSSELLNCYNQTSRCSFEMRTCITEQERLIHTI